MARPTEDTLATLRSKLATRIGRGGQSGAAQNKALLNDFLSLAQEDLWERLEMNQVYDEVFAWIAGGVTTMAYPDDIDPDRFIAVNVDYSGNGDWYPVHEGIAYDHDSVSALSSFPRRYEHTHDYLHFWPQTDATSSITITGITQANPGVVTAAGHGLVDGQEVYLAGIVGMTELNGTIVKAASVTTNTFALQDQDGNDIDTSGYTAYSSGGTAAVGYRFKIEGFRRLGAFAADGDRCTLPSTLVFTQALADAKAHYGHKDAAAYEVKARRLLGRYRGRMHGQRRYVPAGRNHAGRGAELIRPKLLV